MMLIKIMMNFDCFRSFNNAMALTQMSLVQPIDIEEKINELIENKDDGEEENKNDPCSTFTLAKKYIDFDDLEADNLSQIFSDNMMTLHMI